MRRLTTRFPKHVKVLAVAVAVLGLATGAAVGGAPGVHAQDPNSSLLPPLCGGKVPTHVGTPGIDNITGTNGPDVIVGLGGTDQIHGLGGDGVIYGGDGHDVITSRGATTECESLIPIPIL
jgi:Ca2+-binding RTX toxin-like protein